jgi:hypothetical protein
MADQNKILYINEDEVSLAELINGIDIAIKADASNIVVFSHATENRVLLIHSLKKLPPVKEDAK